jgi:hypothetical protein
MTTRLVFAVLVMAGCGGGGLGSNDGADLAGAGDMAFATTCGRAAPNYDLSDPVARYRYGMVATWRGSATTPDGWVPATSYDVEITFAADGTYQAHTLDATGSLPFYWDRDPEADRYEIVAAGPTGASGNLYLEWLDTPDQIENIVFDPQQVALTFDFTHDGHGPVKYSLTCR